jgi:hypothetical protein
LIDLELWNAGHESILGVDAAGFKQTRAGRAVNAETRPIEDRVSDIAYAKSYFENEATAWASSSLMSNTV